MSFQVWFLVYSSFALLSFFSVRSETFHGKSFTKTKINLSVFLLGSLISISCITG